MEQTLMGKNDSGGRHLAAYLIRSWESYLADKKLADRWVWAKTDSCGLQNAIKSWKSYLDNREMIDQWFAAYDVDQSWVTTPPFIWSLSTTLINRESQRHLSCVKCVASGRECCCACSLSFLMSLRREECHWCLCTCVRVSVTHFRHVSGHCLSVCARAGIKD